MRERAFFMFPPFFVVRNVVPVYNRRSFPFANSSLGSLKSWNVSQSMFNPTVRSWNCNDRGTDNGLDGVNVVYSLIRNKITT